MQPHDYVIVTGGWPPALSEVKRFLDFPERPDSLEGYCQLHQTFSSCSLGYLNLDTPLDFTMLEQYRAFGPDWELWLRPSPDGIWRFRFIGRITVVSAEKAASYWNEQGFQLDQKAPAVQAKQVLTESLFLWGEPLMADDGKPLLNDKGEPAGWYTTQIPQILPYPVRFPETADRARVCLQVDRFYRKDGSVELVRYSGLLIAEGLKQFSHISR